MEFVERYNGSGILIEVEDVLYDFKGIQHIQIFKSKSFGIMLVLDGKIQLTERDEAFYHEMLVHPVMITHENPKKILVIGGGDGGAVREILKHEPDEVVLVEIDEEVVNACMRYISIDRGALKDPRVNILFEDGLMFVKDCKESFDVIIVNGTDPNPVSQVLISKEFYRDCARICDYFVTQSQSPFAQQDYFKSIYFNADFRFKKVYLGFVPTYPHGLWSYLIASDRRDITLNLDVIRERYMERRIETIYYTPEVHISAFNLPKWILNLIR